MKKLSLKNKIIISVITLLINIYCFFVFANNYKALYYPSSPRINLSQILIKRNFTASDYSRLFYQTGLGKPAVDALMCENNGKNRIISFQDRYYTRNKFYTEKLNPFTSQETLLTENNNNLENGLAPIKNGDILLTKSTQTLFWRHGHCGIVINAEKGITLESLEPGTLSMKQDINKWNYYPTIKILRLKNANSKLLDKIVKFSEANLVGKKYKIIAPKRYKLIPESENCSQLIWQAFYYYGFDLDSNRGFIVTPKDIAKSPLLETVQVRGFDPDKAW